MKTIHNYLKTYGKYTFLEKEFNEVDNVILSILSYIDFNNIIPGIDCGSITLKDASKKYYKKHDKKDINKNIISVRKASLLLKELADSNRFKDLELLNYEYQVDFDTQFGALCIKLPDKTMYVSYEGTDHYISGWEEDFRLAYEFPIRSQELAVEYLNMIEPFFGPKLYIGGHSKGGNLALIAAMYCKNRIYRKIKHVYNNDGPGLREKEFNSNRYKRVSYKYTHIIPEESLIGILLLNEDNFIVVKSNRKNLFQHDALNWGIEDNHFIRTELSKFSKKARNAMLKWLKKLDDNKRKEFTDTLFGILKKTEIKDLIELKQAKIAGMMKILKQMKNISSENKELLSSTFKILFEEWKS